MKRLFWLLITMIGASNAYYEETPSYTVTLLFDNNTPKAIPPAPTVAPPQPPPVSQPVTVHNEVQNVASLFSINNQTLITISSLAHLFEQAWHAIGAWYKQHETLIATTGILCLAAYMYYLYWRTHRLLQRNSWAAWCLRNNVTTISHALLLEEIHQRHTTAATITHAAQVFAHFLRSITYEKSILYRARLVSRVLNTVPIVRSFNTLPPRHLNRAYKNLEQIEHMFIRWHAHRAAHTTAA